MTGAGVNAVTDGQAGLRLKNPDALFATLVEDAYETVLIIDRDGRVCYANASIERVLGHRPALLLGSELASLVHPEDAAQASGACDALSLSAPRQERTPRMIEVRFGHADGSWPVLESVLSALDAPSLSGIVITSRDITERKLGESILAGQNHVLEMIGMDAPLHDVLMALARLLEAHFDGMHAAILLLDQDGLRARLGAAPSLAPDYLRALDGIAVGSRVGAGGARGAGGRQFALIDVRQDLQWADYRDLAKRHGYHACWAAPILSAKGEVLGALGMHYREPHQACAIELKLAEDTARIAGIAIERKRTEAKFNHMAYHDALTGLPNRVLLQDRLNQAIIHGERIKDSGAVLFIDLDQFKQINDTLGHHAGDRLLQEVARRLQNCMRKEDSLGRLGGDEFVLTLMAPADSRSAAQVAQKIMDALQAPVMLDGLAVKVSCSVGISMYPGDGQSAEVLMRNADIAMYRAKAKGRGNFQYFTPDLNVQVQNRNSIAVNLRQALARGEFSLDYQCQVALSSGAILAVEALLRWRHPERGLIAPLEFIAVAEDTGLILPIGDWVLRAGCAQLKRWHDAGHGGLRLAINLSPRQLVQSDIVNVLAGILTETGLPPTALSLEITEDILAYPFEEKLRTLRLLRQLGVHLSLDHFGTGYSSLADLQRLSLDSLKIDGSFIRGIGGAAKDMALTNAIIAMAAQLQLQVIAEGVETGEQASFLRAHGCQVGQGYFYGKPVTADILGALLRAQTP